MIELKNVTKVYQTDSGPRTILNNLNLRIEHGQRVGIIGGNGAGKSTLVRLISGAERPTCGHIERTMSVSWPLAFSGGFQPGLTGADNLRFICRIYGIDFSSRIEFVRQFSDLGDYLNEPVGVYSSGMRARLAFAASMIVDFDCYLIDEVAAVGDQAFRAKCEIELFQKRSDRAMIIVSHSFKYLRDHCTRYVMLRDGELEEFDTLEAVSMAHKRHQKVADKEELRQRKWRLAQEKLRIEEYYPTHR